MKPYTLILAISFFAIAAIWFFKQGKSECEKYISEQKYIQEKTLREESERVLKRKIVNSAIDTNSNLEWLQNNLCTDCN
jgi:hypothetical protein